MTVAALYVSRHGPYMAMAGVDPWTIDRDATKYAGPWPVVAHPPCGHWGRYHQRAHDDGRTGPIAVEQVRRFGGVLEHPRDSKLWRHCGLPRPGEFPDEFGGYSVKVNQYDFGHAAVKRTWLYVVGCSELPPRPVPRPLPRWPEGSPMSRRGMLECMSKIQRILTPPAFAEWLVEVATRSAATERKYFGNLLQV
jgi:hypothetical protein